MIRSKIKHERSQQILMKKYFKTQQGNSSSYISELKEVIHEILNSQKSQSPGTKYVSKKPIVC
jgi:hypothetical protein